MGGARPALTHLPPTAACALALACAGSAWAAPAPGTLVQQRVPSEAPGSKYVREAFVRIYDPLPASAGPHPESCDWISYLRFRSRKGPRKSRRADAVIVLMPGFLGGAASFDQIARNAVRLAARRKRRIEVWGLDRRANCVEDHHGVEAAAAAENASLAYDYYWHGREVRGRRFGGFKSSSETKFLGDFGLERTIRDWHTVITRVIPSQRTRARKVICGGHSLGGPLTAAFASWDFDGDPGTTSDAGYNQCAGLVGLDTSFELFGSSDQGPPLGPMLELADQSGAAPYVNAPPLTPETIQLPVVFGVGAYFQPDGTDLLRNLPHSTDIDLSQRLLFSRDAIHFATGSPSVRDFTLTNEVVLGGVLDDNSAPIFFLRTSLGMVTGGELADKNFPAPSGGFLALTEEPATPLYSWESYDEVGAPGHPLALNDSGEPYSSHEGEVTDIHQLARSLFEAPADFVEQYFPTRLLGDVAAAGNGDRSGELSAMRHDGPAMRPGLLIQGGDSDDNSPPDDGPPRLGTAPNELPESREVIIPGYNHIDVATAARRQNDGRVEPSSRALVRFALRLVPKPRRPR